MASNPLIGTWRLLSWENRSVQDAQVSYPLGKDATGYIMYNEEVSCLWPSWLLTA